MNADLNPLSVVAGLLTDERGAMLLAARPPGKAMAGRWEFPGGKVDAGESEPTALVRELAEELGIAVDEADCEPFHSVTHRYPGSARSVRIAAYRVRSYRGVPRGQEGQALAWHPPKRLHEVDILEADRPIVTAIRLGRQLSLAALASDVVLVDRVDAIPADRHSATITGFWLADPLQAVHAAAAGADFLLLQPSCPIDQPLLCACGLPWYTPSGSAADGAHGSWSGGY